MPAARPTADRDAEGGAARGGGGGGDEGLAFDPDDDQHVRTALGDGDGAVQVETEVAGALFSNWPQEQDLEATELLDLFFGSWS